MKLPFEEAHRVARGLGLKSMREWQTWHRSEPRPGIPAQPARSYKDTGWQGFGHWLGTGNTPTQALVFRPFDEAAKFAQSLKLGSRRQWEAWSSGLRPADIPSNPDITYKHDGWQGYGHWLGTGNVGVKKDHQFLPFKKALLCARSLKLKSCKEWQAWCKRGARPANMPSHPDTTYKHDGWQGYGHWLGTGNLVGGKLAFLPFNEALLYAHSLKLKSQKEWRDWAKTGDRPANMPSAPDEVYKHDGWQGYGHWLGTGNLVGGKLAFLPFKKALLYARSLKLKGQKEWQDWAKTDVWPANMPSRPDITYRHEGWQGWGHWLGTSTVARNAHPFLPFKQAVLYARALKLNGQKEWEAWSKSCARPANIPSAPGQTYTHNGWQGYGHWLTGQHGTAANEACQSKYNTAAFFFLQLAHNLGLSCSLLLELSTFGAEVPAKTRLKSRFCNIEVLHLVLVLLFRLLLLLFRPKTLHQTSRQTFRKHAFRIEESPARQTKW